MPNLGATSYPSSFQVGVTSIPLALGRNDREVLRLFNSGPNVVYLGFNATAAIASTGYPVAANAESLISNYNGEVRGITTGSAFLYVNDTTHG